MFSLLVLLALSACSVSAGPHMMQTEFYMASGESDDCGSVPADVMTGNPMSMACANNVAMDEICVCVKQPPLAAMMAAQMEIEMEGVNAETNFKRVCGKCKDPCALRFRPMPKPMPDIGKRIMNLVSNLMDTMVGDKEDGKQY